jgi:arylsulfatase A
MNKAFLLFLLSVLGLAACPAAAQGASRPNFLVILCDDLGWGDLACQGHPHIRTPHLDRLAKEGARYTSCYSTSPVCSPSRVGLLTGRNPNRAGVYDWIPNAGQVQIAGKGSRHLVHLRRDEITLPKLLKQAGYATALSGKWHCNARFNHPAQPQPDDAGFDHWFATQNNAAPTHENPVNYVRNGQPVGPLEGYSCDLAAREAIGWLERQRAENPAQPFFLYVAFHEPHERIASPPDLVASYRGKARNENEAQYFANVENLDGAVGELLAALDRLQVAQNTVVLFTSDNGPETLNRYPTAQRSYGATGPLRGMKLWTTEGGVRVPGILRWPGHVRAGMVSDEPVGAIDLLPTFCALAEVEVPSTLELDGADIRPAFNGEAVRRSQPLFWVYFNALNEQRVALRDGPWKLLAKLDGGALPMIENVTEAMAKRVREAKLTDFSLYKLTEDIDEARDVSDQEPERLRQLAVRMESLYRQMTATMHIWPDIPPSSAAGGPKIP